MTDHIQPEPPQRPKTGPADFQGSPEPLVDELRHRLRVLEQEKRRWKLIGVSALIALALLVVGGGSVGVGASLFYAVRARDEQMRALEAERRARDEAEQARMEAEQAREAQRVAEEARRRAEEAK